MTKDSTIPTSIRLRPDELAMLDKLVREGRYPNTAEAIHHALWLLFCQDADYWAEEERKESERHERTVRELAFVKRVLMPSAQVYDLPELLGRCSGTTLEQIRSWATSHTAEIMATGVSLEDFITAKLDTLPREGEPDKGANAIRSVVTNIVEATRHSGAKRQTHLSIVSRDISTLAELGMVPAEQLRLKVRASAQSKGIDQQTAVSLLDAQLASINVKTPQEVTIPQR